MKKRAIVRILVWTFVAMVLLVTLLVGIGGFSFKGIDSKAGFGLNASFAYDDADSYSAGAYAFDGQSIHTVDINWVSGEVNVEFYDGNELMLDEQASRALDASEMMRYRVRNGVLTIQYCESRLGIRLLNGIPNKALTVRIPVHSGLKTLDIENVSSSINIRGAGASLDEIALENVSGSVSIRDIAARELTCATVSGSINVEGAFEAIDAEAVSGSQTYRLATTPREMDTESVSGSVTVTLTKDAGFRASLDSVSGSLSSDFAEQVERRELRYGDGRNELQFESVSGSVTINYDGSVMVTRLSQPDKPSASPKASATPEPTKNGDPVPLSQRGF